MQVGAHADVGHDGRARAREAGHRGDLDHPAVLQALDASAHGAFREPQGLGDLSVAHPGVLGKVGEYAAVHIVESVLGHSWGTNSD